MVRIKGCVKNRHFIDWDNVRERNVIIHNKRKFKKVYQYHGDCVYCGCPNLRKHGFRFLKGGIVEQLYLCNGCCRKFTFRKSKYVRVKPHV